MFRFHQQHTGRRAVFAAALLAAFLQPGAPAQAAPAYPFGSQPLTYAAGSIAPDHVGQATLDQSVRDFYDAWKAEYLSNECGPGRYVVLASLDGGNLTVSEAHGYGMMMLALMAGHDADAQDLFDGMYAHFLEHPTATHDRLMSWYQSKSCNDAEGNDSATDGDLDIAFALLLADRQWGSCGRFDYASEAAAVLEDIEDGELDATGSWPLLGDWVTASDPTYYDSTRSSDLLTDHFRSFAAADPTGPWATLRDTVYTLVAAVQASAAPATGLLPDFIVDPDGTPAPAAPGFLEGSTDGAYAYNACRVPWRLATDYLVSGDARAKTAVDSMNGFMRSATAEDPSAIRAGYKLDGTPTAGSNYLSMVFVAPFGVSAMTDAANQSWLNDVWDLVVATPLADESYFENTVKLLSMIVMSGNWWAPEEVAAPVCVPETTTLCTSPGEFFRTRVRLKKLGNGAGQQKMSIDGELFFMQTLPGNAADGAQILVEDVGSGDSAIYELSVNTASVPGDGDPQCHERDKWRVKSTKAKYSNRSGAIDAPTCTAGSANGLSKLQYKIRGERDLSVKLKTKHSTIANPVGPLRVTLVLGDTAAASNAGACAVSAELTCTEAGSSLRCQ